MEGVENKIIDIESLDPDYYENAVQRFGAKWSRELREKWLRKARIDICIHTIRWVLADRFPEIQFSSKCSDELQRINDMSALESIEEYCFDAPSVAHIEGFIEAKFRERNDAKENN